MTRSTSAVAVCCSSDSRSSFNNRVFSMAMTACAAPLNPPSISPAAIFSAAVATWLRNGGRDAAAVSEAASDASRSPEGSARISLRKRSGRCCATRKAMCPPRECPMDVVARAKAFDEGNHVGHMLRYGEAVPTPSQCSGKKRLRLSEMTR
jgi:hypothetical protein